ncbi:MAG: response regulator, partial [Anaerolineae bacterium]|nr:response regulator [Anaerolineae bacterium]
FLEKTLSTEPVALRALVEGVIDTTRPLAQNLGVSVTCAIPDKSPPLNVQLTTVRQALLYIITTAIRFTPQGHVEINVETLPGWGNIGLQIKSQQGSDSLVDAERGKELEFAEKLLEMSKGELDVTIDSTAGTPFIANVILPTTQPIPVLVVDDNPDLLGLVQRYLSNTRYEFHGTSDPQAALPLAEELAPEIILLDVMLPGLDGWELVGRLREHPQTQRSAIIVCTVLPQDKLALTLGATDFIRKPIRRNALLTVFDRQMEQLSKEALPSAS